MERVPEDDLVGRLADTEARLDGLTGALPGIAFRRVMTPDGQISYPWFSNSLFDILGYAPDSMASGQNGCLNAVHWADRDAHRRAVLLSAETLTACPEEFRAVTSSGRVRWLKGGSRPRRAGDGSIVWDGVLIDVTGSREATFRLEMLMDHAADAIIVLDDNTAIDTVNGAASRLFDYRPGQLTGQPFSLLVPGADLGGGLVGGGPREMLACRRDGTTFPIELSTEAVRHESGRLFIAIGRDITERKSAERRLSFLAYFDPLTRLPNRTAFVDRVNGIGREGAAFGVLSLGIDRFGVINATLGHSAGDQVLIGLGDIVQAALRPGDLLARASGDRFLVLLDGGTSRIDLEEAVARVHTTAQAAINVAGEPLDVSVSVGAAFCPDDGPTPTA